MPIDKPDMELVQEFARSGSEAAFGEIVRRHLNLVHSVALRCTSHERDAQDVVQAVFIVLARKAGCLSSKTVLPGWLYETTRHTAARLLRTNTRRHAREQEAYMQSTLNAGSSDRTWEQVAPHLEAAMSGLAERDRALLVLRYYQNQTGAQAAAQLGIREDAVHKRTGRALEKLRTLFTQRGITLSAAAIAAAVSANSVHAAPAGLGVKVTSAAVISATIAHGTGLISVATLQKVVVSMVLVAAFGFLIYQTRQTGMLRDQIQQLKQGQAPLLVAIQQLQRERDAAVSRATALADELAKDKHDNLELLRLRGEVGVLRQTQTAQPVQASPVVGAHYDVITRHETTLIGLVELEDFKLAILECRDWAPNGTRPKAQHYFIREGQSYEDAEVKDAHVKIEIVKVDSKKRTVEARENGVNQTYRLVTDEKSTANPDPASFRLSDSNLNTVFDLYSALTGNGHTLLVHPEARKKMTVAIAANPQNKAEAVQYLTNWLTEQGFTIVPDGTKFKQIIPNALASVVQPGSTALPATKPENELPKGMISFENVGFENIRDIYAKLAGQKIVPGGRISVSITLRSNNPLSSVEALYAFDVLLAWQGVKIVKINSQLANVVQRTPPH